MKNCDGRTTLTYIFYFYSSAIAKLPSGEICVYGYLEWLTLLSNIQFIPVCGGESCERVNRIIRWDLQSAKLGHFTATRHIWTTMYMWGEVERNSRRGRCEKDKRAIFQFYCCRKSVLLRFSSVPLQVEEEEEAITCRCSFGPSVCRISSGSAFNMRS